jgi:preprotein translocase subunit SecG
MPDRDLILLETVKTHRARLVSAFLSGELAERRVINDNLRRLVGGIVLAAVFCAGSIGFSFISAQLGKQNRQQQQEQAMGPATGPVFASDTFDRTTTDGWGQADRGGTWRLAGPSDAYAVTGGAGTIALSPASTGSDQTERGGYLPGLEEDYSDVTVTVRPEPALTAGGSIVVSVQGRRVSSDQDYRAVVRLLRGGGTSVSLVRVSASNQVDGRVQQVSPTVTTPGSADAGDEPIPVRIRLQVIGSNPTTLRAKVWTGAGAEPQNWTVTGSDSTPDLQRPGTVGLLASGGAVQSGRADQSDLAVTDLVARKAP